MKTLPRVLLLLGLATLISNSSATAADDPLPSLDELLKEYQSLGLPLPPSTANLVRYEGRRHWDENGILHSSTYGLAFQLKPGTSTERPVVLRGIHEWGPKDSDGDPRTRQVKPDATAARDIDLYPETALALAIQCHARGWDELAKELLTSSKLKETEVTTRERLLDMAWSYWTSQLTHPTADRSLAAKRLNELILRGADFDTESNRALLKSLDLALVPGKGKPGSVDALIDNLVDYHAETGTLGTLNSGERYWRLVELGFDAVPALIEHLDDDRLTRATMTEFNNVWPMRIQHVVSDLIEGLAAEELGRGTAGEDEVGRKRSHRQEGYPVTKRAANEWWEKARKVGEEAYLKERVLPVRRAEGKPAQVNEHLLRVIAAKYPMHVPSLYQTVLDKRTELPSWGLAQALIRSKLQEKDKFDLLRHAVKHKQLEHRLSALEAIKELDRHEFTTLLLAAIEALPTDVPGEYWLCQEVKVAALAVETDDPGVWAAVGKAIKRSAVGLRMEILTVFASPRDTRRLVERYRLLTSFLDDAEVRDLRSDKRFLGGGAGDSYQRLEVRNLVAIELAQLMAIDVKEKPDRSPGEWARLRDLVRDEVKRELGRAK